MSMILDSKLFIKLNNMLLIPQIKTFKILKIVAQPFLRNKLKEEKIKIIIKSKKND